MNSVRALKPCLRQRQRLRHVLAAEADAYVFLAIH